jgi:hypothetical protein
MSAGTKSGWYPGRCKDCAEPALEDAARCAECRVAHNARETARRKARRKAALCTVCGAKAVTVDGVALTTCKLHREYYRARAAG